MLKRFSDVVCPNVPNKQLFDKSGKPCRHGTVSNNHSNEILKTSKLEFRCQLF